MLSFHITKVEAKCWNPVIVLQTCKLNEYFSVILNISSYDSVSTVAMGIISGV